MQVINIIVIIKSTYKGFIVTRDFIFFIRWIVLS